MDIERPEKPKRQTRREAVVETAAGCVRRLLELGLPEQHAFVARDAIISRIENYHDRLMAGEWEPR